MASRNRSRYVMKENRIPIGKKKENLEKKGELHLSNDNESGLIENQILQKKKQSKTKRKSNKIESNAFSIGNINEVPTDTSLSKPIKQPRSKLSTITELEERVAQSNIKAKMIREQTKTNDISVSLENDADLIEGSTKLIRGLQEETKSVELDTTVNAMVPDPPIAEIVLSPFVCTTRGKKWRPTPRKSSKLSELFAKYEDDNIADAYRKKLDEKTIELQNKVKCWTELSSENDINIPKDIKDEIDVVCGQTKLLTTDKFMQMRTLIEEFDNKSGSMPITTTDLDGFWDMLLLQVEKLEGQFSQLEILKDNNWAAIEPVAKKLLNKGGLKFKKGPAVKSKFADFIKNQKIKNKNATFNSDNSVTKKGSENHFNKMKLSNNTCLISSTPTTSYERVSNFSPVLLKTIELSFVARRSGMTPIVLNEPHDSPLKPALKNREQEKGGTKRKNIQFETPETNDDGFVSLENIPNDDLTRKKSNVQNRIVTPHTRKILKMKQNDMPQNISTCVIECVQSDVKIKANNKTKLAHEERNLKKLANSQKTVSVLPQKRVATSSSDIGLNNKPKKNVTKGNGEVLPVVDTQMNDSHSIRRSSRLANKPLKNYKV